MATDLEIFLLGGLQVRQNGAAVASFMSSKAPALLAYLAVTGRPHQREALAGLLWGEMPDAAAANNLRQVLSNLRKLFDPHLLITRDTVAFNRAAPHFLDIDAFSELLRLSSGQPAGQRAGLLRQALSHYQGDFLHGFYVRDAPDFEDWALVERVRLRDLALGALDQLTQLLLESGQCQEAVESSARLLAMDPWREEAHRWRMLALARCGQHSAALAQYQSCRKVLSQEFDAAPAAETTALYQRIRAAMNGPRHNLPAALTGFVGRQQELAELHSLLASPNTRWLTILGPGGAGKTRLAVETARAGQSMFLNGVWFVPLTAAAPAGPEALAAAIAQAVGCPLNGPDAPEQQLLAFLRSRELLLVLDNLEEWLDAAGWLSGLLAQAPEVKVLATSRQRVDLQAERVYTLEGLPTPPPATADPSAFAAVQLYLRRVRRVEADFVLEGEEAAAAAQICRLVQGLPLGIELAAAWTTQLSSAEIAAQIERSLDFLATSRRDVHPRQRSLRAVFDWSWSRLPAPEQAAFARLAVFSGPFTRAAAEQVAGATPAILGALLDKSLAWRRGQLYQLHQVASQFGCEKLSQAGEAEATHARHARHYARFLAHLQEQTGGRYQPAGLAEIEQELDNVRAAWQRLIDAADVAGLADAAAGYYPYLAIRSHFREGYAAFAAARLALQPLATAGPLERLTYAQATARAGRFLSFLSRYAEARPLLEESLAIFTELGNRDEMAFALSQLGGTERMEGNLALAEEHLRACLALRQETGNLAGQAVAQLELAGVSFLAGDFAATQAGCQEGLAAAEAAGDMQTAAHLLTGLSLSSRELGQFDQALAYGRRSQAIYEQLGDRYGQLQAALTLGELSRQMGDLAQARRFSQEATQLSQEIGDRSGEASSHYRLGRIAAGLGEREEALRHLRLTLEIGQEIGEAPLVLDTLLEIGCLLGAGNARERGAQILAALLAQPQLPERQRQRVSQALAALPAPPVGRPAPSLEEAAALALR